MKFIKKLLRIRVRVACRQSEGNRIDFRIEWGPMRERSASYRMPCTNPFYISFPKFRQSRFVDFLNFGKTSESNMYVQSKEMRFWCRFQCRCRCQMQNYSVAFQFHLHNSQHLITRICATSFAATVSRNSDNKTDAWLSVPYVYH